MNRVLGMGLCVGLMIVSVGMSNRGLAGELDDGISTYTDEKIKDDDQALKPDTNMSFIIQDAISASKKSKKDSSNFNDGSGENNQNSIIVGPGTQTGDVINVIIEK